MFRTTMKLTTASTKSSPDAAVSWHWQTLPVHNGNSHGCEEGNKPNCFKIRVAVDQFVRQASASTVGIKSLYPAPGDHDSFKPYS